MIGRVYTICMEVRKSVDCLVLVDRSLLPRRLCIWLSENRLRGEDVFLEEALLDELLQVFSEGPVMDALLPPTVMIGAVLLRLGQ